MTMTTDEFELRFIEHLRKVDFVMLDPEVRERFMDLGADPEKYDALMREEPPELDMELIHRIAKYLVEEEELLNDFPEFPDAEELEDLLHNPLMCALFIYGWEQTQRSTRVRVEVVMAHVERQAAQLNDLISRLEQLTKPEE